MAPILWGCGFLYFLAAPLAAGLFLPNPTGEGSGSNFVRRINLRSEMFPQPKSECGYLFVVDRVLVIFKLYWVRFLMAPILWWSGYLIFSRRTED